MKKVLVIGGNGFIGKNVVELLMTEQYHVGIYDIAPSPLQGITSHVGNIINDDNLDKIISSYNVVIYLISAIMPKQSMEEPLSSYSTDIPLLIKTLEACKKNGIERVIYASSGGTIYGDQTGANTENLFLEPINHYAICKLTCEKILMLYNQLYSMQNVVLRISNPYGKYQRITSGVGAVNTFTYNLIKEEEIHIWGDGENIRDYIDVKYVAEAFHLSINWKFREDIVPIFNVGSGVGLSLNQLLQIIADELKITPKVTYYPERNFDVKSNYLDMTKTQQVLGLRILESSEKRIREYVNYCKDILK